MPAPFFEAFDPLCDPWPTLAVDALHLWLLPHRHGQRSVDALRTGIARYLDIDEDIVDLHRSDTGRLVLASPASDLRFSASHSGDALLLGFLRGDASVNLIGVDIERLKPRPNALALARRYFTAYEAGMLGTMPQPEREGAFHRLWTAKEALLKALGQGLAHGLDRVGFNFAGSSLQLRKLDITSTRFGPDAAIATPTINRWNLFECAPLPGYRACVAYSDSPRAIRAWMMR